MATYSKELLSASTNGKGILVAATATAGTLIHTAVSGTTDIDEVWLYAVNAHSADIKLTLEWGEATEPTGNIEQTVPFESGLMLLVPGLLLQNGLTIKAFAGTANEVVIHGYVNKIDK
jgi:hypothetical protein|tara:strand:- start:533 stop:886 length:354 start_codon:yes stop_codon:yes gene_type:complete